MSREKERIRKRLEKNPIAECNKIQRRFIPELFSMFDEVADPRHQSYIKYDTREMLGTMYYKCIGGISSMQGMTREFNNDNVVNNLYSFMNRTVKDFLPHGVTENDFFEKLNPKELEKIQQDIVYSMIRRRTFDDARVFKRWNIIVDATELDEGYRQKNEYYLSRCYNKGEANEFTKYHRSVLEAKIYFGNNIVCSIATEPIENSNEYVNQSDETVKQDCERKAFVRLAEKIKNYLMEQIADFIKQLYEYFYLKKNEIMFHDYDVNLIYYRERRVVKATEKETEFAWITNIKITKSNVRKIIAAGRNRWKIENQGFNRQKHWQGNIEHACSWNERAQKNHYLMEQIADFIKQLYEYFYLKKNEIKKLQKNISSELLSSFGQQLTETEDILTVKLNNTALN